MFSVHLPYGGGEDSSEMKGASKTIDELASEKLPKEVDQAIGRIEFVIDLKKSPRVFYFRATREQCEMGFKWGKLVTLIAGISKLWS